jgi:hypothetical protein
MENKNLINSTIPDSVKLENGNPALKVNLSNSQITQIPKDKLLLLARRGKCSDYISWLVIMQD